MESAPQPRTSRSRASSNRFRATVLRARQKMMDITSVKPQWGLDKPQKGAKRSGGRGE